MVFLFLFIIPLVIAACTFIFGKRKVIWQEFVGQLVVSAAVAGISIAIIYHQNVSDVEILNGSVTKKASVKVHCRHDYCCGWCESCSGTGKNRSCHMYCCHTCYDHPFDIDWEVYTTLGTYDIEKIDRQGLREPSRWTEVYVGEPVSKEHDYTNYIKASPDSLFRDQGLLEAYKGKIPAYPDKVYDYYRINRLVRVGQLDGDPNAWNKGISELNSRVGASKQANVVVVLTTEDNKFYYALRQHWLGGKKNDVVVVIGVDGSHIKWARVMSWAKDDIFNVKLRDDLLDMGTLTSTGALATIEKNVVQNFQRKPMADFDYLQSSITPTRTQLVWSIVINMLIAVGLTIFVIKNDIEQEK